MALGDDTELRVGGNEAEGLGGGWETGRWLPKGVKVSV